MAIGPQGPTGTSATGPPGNTGPPFLPLNATGPQGPIGGLGPTGPDGSSVAGPTGTIGNSGTGSTGTLGPTGPVYPFTQIITAGSTTLQCGSSTAFATQLNPTFRVLGGTLLFFVASYSWTGATVGTGNLTATIPITCQGSSILVTVSQYSGINTGTTEQSLFGILNSGDTRISFYYYPNGSTTLTPITQAMISTSGSLNLECIYPI